MQKVKSILAIIAVITLFSSCGKEEMNLYYPTDELVSYFPFEGSLQDAHGDTPEGTKSEFGVIYDNGRVGQCIKLDGNNGKVEFDRTDFSTGNTFSVSVWFKTGDTGDVEMIRTSDFVIYISFTFIVFDLRGTFFIDRSFLEFLPNTWVHLVGAYDGERLKIYMNEALLLDERVGYDLGNEDLLFALSPLSDWAGSMDELFIYDKALTQEEVTQLFNR